jgi:hypothetical protein
VHREEEGGEAKLLSTSEELGAIGNGRALRWPGLGFGTRESQRERGRRGREEKEGRSIVASSSVSRRFSSSWNGKQEVAVLGPAQDT